VHKEKPSLGQDVCLGPGTASGLVRKQGALQCTLAIAGPLLADVLIKVIFDILLIKNIHIRYCAVASCDSRQKAANVPSAGTGTL
jgi:hypothetical protein